VQARAAGAGTAGLNDDEDGKQAKAILQVASLHQLRIFLKKDDGYYFQRPALELLLAGHAHDMDELGTGQLEAIRIGNRKKYRQAPEVRDPLPILKNMQLQRVAMERRGILRDEASLLFRSSISFLGRNYDLLELEIPEGLSGLNFSKSSFFGTAINCLSIEKHIFHECRFQGADLRETGWSTAPTGVFTGATFDEFTKLGKDESGAWESLAEEEKARLRQAFIDLGAIWIENIAGVKLPSVTASRRSVDRSATTSKNRDS
jgi:hypothetical protein